MNQDNYFTRVPDALYDALRDGEITPLMFNIMLHLHHWADWNTGIVRTCNANRLRAAMGGHHDDEVSEVRTIQRALQGLDEAGWIISGCVKGMKQPYGVQITNYQPVADAEGEKALIIPMDTKHWKETKAFQGADKDAEKALTQTVKRRLKERDSLRESSNESLHENLITTKPNQAINQAIKEANASSEIPDEDQTPFVSEYAQPNQNQEDPASDEGWIEELGMFFPRCPATQENLAMLKEVYAKLEGETVLLYGRKVALDIQRVISFNWEHHEGKLRIRSLRQAWNAIVHGDPENGVVAQAIAHNEETCRQCRKRLEADAKKEAIAQKADPMWKTDPVTEARSLVRKPKTASERRSLLDLRNKPKVRWEYIAKFLAQDNCPKCRGQSTSCACVMQEELLCDEFMSRGFDIEEGAVA